MTTTWDQLTDALTATIASFAEGTYLTIQAHDNDAAWMQAVVLDGTTDTHIVSPIHPDHDRTQWTNQGWTDKPGAWDATLIWPTPTSILRAAITQALNNLRTHYAITNPEQLEYTSWTDGHWEDDQWIPMNDAHVLPLLPLQRR